MVKNLYIIRHAQALEATRDIKDVERTLTQKGYKDASRLGKYFLQENIIPDLLIASSADRASSTASLIAEQLKLDSNKIRINDDLYQASVRVFLDIVNHIPKECENVLIVGHNPTLVYFAEYITKSDVGEVEPGGMIHVQFDLAWDLISQGNGNFISYKSPEDILP